MSVINNLPPGFTNAEAPAYQSPLGGGFGGANVPIASDAIAFGSQYGQGYGGQSYGGLYGGSSSGSTGLGGFAGIMNGFMSMLSNALTSLGNMLGGGSTASQQSAGDATGGSMLPQQNYFSTASASSTGDPHDAFDGTTGQGTSVGAKWDSMQCHPELLNSDSFAGGYRVSTTTTAPQANGVTYNATATVATNGGATGVTINATGSYAVTENGQNVTLAQGQATALGANESVTLNADGSLTVADTNARGGTIDTTLASSGQGVDVHATASNVDLGGYLVRHTDGGIDPVAQTGQNGGYGGYAGSSAYGGTVFQPYNGALGSNPFGTFTDQLGASNSSFADVRQLLQNDGATS